MISAKCYVADKWRGMDHMGVGLELFSTEIDRWTPQFIFYGTPDWLNPMNWTDFQSHHK